MPIYVKQDAVKFRQLQGNEYTGNYYGIDTISDTTTEEKVAEINNAASSAMNNINNTVTTANSTITSTANSAISNINIASNAAKAQADTLNANVQTIANAIEHAEGNGVDPTLTLPNVAAEAKATGDAIGELKSAFSGPRNVVGNETALIQLLSNGVYRIESVMMRNMTDLPSGCNTTQVSTLVNKTNAYSGGNFIIQDFYQLTKKVWRRLLNAANGSIYTDWYRIDNLDIDTNLSALTARVETELTLSNSTINTFGFVQLNDNNIIKNPIIYGPESFGVAYDKYYKAGDLVFGNSISGVGKSIWIPSASGFTYLVPLSRFVTGEYTCSIKKSVSSVGRLEVNVVVYSGSSYGTLVQNKLSPITSANPEWTFSLDIEDITENYPTANGIAFLWNNTSQNPVYFEQPMVCLSSVQDKTVYHLSNQYKPEEVINPILDTVFEPGMFEEQEITYEETDGYYAYSGTQFNTYARVHTSTLIPKISDTVKFTGSAWAQVPPLVYFNANQEKIGCYPATKPDGLYVNYTNEIVNIPSNVSYIRIQDEHNKQNGTLAPVLYFSTGKMAKEANHALVADSVSGVMHDTSHILYGKKLVTAGDSYTHAAFGNETYNGKNYGYYVAQRHNMTFINSGISGSIMAISKEHLADPDNVAIDTRQPFSYQRYLQVPADTDYLTIWFGINDASHTNLGTIDDTTNETFYGAWNFVLKYFLTNYPFMKIGLICTTGANPSYRQAVRDVGLKWGYPVLDWVQDTKIPAFFQRDGMSEEALNLRRAAFGYNDYSAHPSPQWHEYASTIYENFLMSL